MPRREKQGKCGGPWQESRCEATGDGNPHGPPQVIKLLHFVNDTMLYSFVSKDLTLFPWLFIGVCVVSVEWF